MDLLPYDVEAQRKRFPALSRLANGRPAAFLDGPAGSQVPTVVIDAISRYLIECNANHGGAFATSRDSDARLDAAHQAAADFLGADDPGCVVFGQNMTSLTFALSRALARTWLPGDEVMVTHCDHDANVSPWVLAAQDAGAVVRRIDVDPDGCTLRLEDFRAKLSPRTRLVAVGCASNAVGTVHPVAEIAKEAHAAGALVFLDAVHYAPHLLPDVKAWDCDFAACSAYKFFGPHTGMLYGKRERLEALRPYKLRPAPEALPGLWMTGTQSHESILGVQAAIDYLADLGRRHIPWDDASTVELPAAGLFSEPPEPPPEGGLAALPPHQRVGRREALRAAFAVIQRHEASIFTRLLAGLAALPSVQIYGIVDPHRFHERVATVAFRHARCTPKEVAEKLDAEGIFVWHGNFYALPLTERLGLEPDGLVRVGLLHYNTMDEVHRLLAALARLEG